MVEACLPPITNKHQSYDLWMSGKFGNRLRAWRTLEEWRASDYEGKVALRTMVAGGGPCLYDLDPSTVFSRHRQLVSEGYSPEEIMICEMAPDHRLVLNGEFLADIVDSRWGHLHYSRVRKPMRIALREASEDVTGIVAQMMLKCLMTPDSWEDFEELSRSYQGHVIELSIYDHCLGDVPGRNTLIWEVRRY